MSYVILKNIEVSNANAISGFTWGFPAVTHFLGYVHALSRHLSQGEQPLTLGGCAIIAHHTQVHAHRDNQYEPYAFALTRNPLTKEGKTAPIVEEGRMQLKVSLVIECQGLGFSEAQRESQLNALLARALRQKLAGGLVTHIDACYSDNGEQHKKLLRQLLPGFVLVDRSETLAQLNLDQNPEPTPETSEGVAPVQENTKLRHWLSISELKRQATRLTEGEGQETVNWDWVPKPVAGYVVPVQVGYKKIAPTYFPDNPNAQGSGVLNARDPNLPFSFVESVHSIAEWVGSPSRIGDMSHAIWRYHYQDPFYVCQSSQSQNLMDTLDKDEVDPAFEDEGMDDDEFDFEY